MMNRATDASAGSCYQFLDLSDAGECDAATLRGLLYPSSPSTATDSRQDDGSVSVAVSAAVSADNSAGKDNVARAAVAESPKEGIPGTASVEPHPKMVELRDAEVMSDMKLLLPAAAAAPTANPIALNPNAQAFDPMLMMVVLPNVESLGRRRDVAGAEPSAPPTVTNPDRHRMVPFAKSIANGGMMLPAGPTGPLVTMVLPPPPGTDLLLRPPVPLADPPQSLEHLPAGATGGGLPPAAVAPPPALLPTPSLSFLTVVKPPNCSKTTVQAKQQQHQQLPSSSSSSSSSTAFFQSTIGAVPTAPPAALPATPVNEAHSSSFVVNSGGPVGDEPWIAHSDQRKTSGGGAVAAEEVATRTCVVTSAATMPPLTNNALQQPPPPSQQQQQQQQQPPPSNQQQPSQQQQGHNVIVPSGRGTGSTGAAGSGAGDGRMISGGGGGGGASDGGRNADRENANNQQLQSITVSSHQQQQQQQQQQMVPHVYQPIPAYMQPGPHGMYPVPMVPQTVPNNNVYVSNLTANVNVHGYVSHPMSPYAMTGAQYLPAEVSSGQEIQLLQTAPIMQPSRGTMRRGGRNNRGGNNSRSRGGYVPHFIQQQQQQHQQHQQQQQQQHHHFHQSQGGGAGMQTLVHHQGGQSAQALQSQQQQQQQQQQQGGGGNGGQQQTPPSSSGGQSQQQQQGPHHPPPQHTPELIHMDAPMMGGAGQYGGYGYYIPVMPSQHPAAQHATGTPLFMTPPMPMYYQPSVHGYPSGYPMQLFYPPAEYPLYEDKGDDQQQQQHGAGGGSGSHDEAGMHAVAEGHPGMWAGPPMTVEYHPMEPCEYLQGHEEDGSVVGGGGAIMQGGPPPSAPQGMPPPAASGMTHHHHVLDPNVPGFTMQMQSPDEFLALQGGPPAPAPAQQQNGANGVSGEDYNALNNNTIISAIAGTNTSNTGEGTILEHPPPVTMGGDVPSLPQRTVVHTQAGDIVIGEGGGYLLPPHQQEQPQQQQQHHQQQHHQQQANLMVDGTDMVLVDQQRQQQQHVEGGSLNNNFIVDQQYIQTHPPPHLTQNPAVIHHVPPPVPHQQQEPNAVLHQHQQQTAQEIPMNLTEPPPPANSNHHHQHLQQQQQLPPFTHHSVEMHAQQQPPTQVPQLVPPAPIVADVEPQQPVLIEAVGSDTNNNSSKPGDAVVVMTKPSTITAQQQPSTVNTGSHNHSSKATNAQQQHASQQHQQTSTATAGGGTVAGHVPNPKVTQRPQQQQQQTAPSAPQSSQPYYITSGYVEVVKAGVPERMANLSLKDERRPSSYAAAATEGTQARPPATAAAAAAAAPPPSQQSTHAPNAPGVWVNSGNVGTGGGGSSKKSTASVSVSAIPNKEFSSRSKNTSHATSELSSTATGAATNVSQSSSTGFRQSSAGSAGQKAMANVGSNESAVHHHQRHGNAGTSGSTGGQVTGAIHNATMGGTAAPAPPQMESKKVEAIPQRTVSTTAVASNSSMSGATAIEASTGGKTGHHQHQQQQQQQQRDVVIVPTATNTVKSAAKPAAVTINHPLNVPPPAHHPLNIPPPIIVPPPQIPTTGAAAPPQPNKTWASLFNSSSSSAASTSSSSATAAAATIPSSSIVNTPTPALPTAPAPGLGAAARSTTPSSSSVSSTHHQATVAATVTQQQQQHHQHHHHPAAGAVSAPDRTASHPSSSAINFAPPINRNSVSGGQTAVGTVASTHTNVSSTPASSSTVAAATVVNTAVSTPKNPSNDGTGNAKKPVAKVQPYERNHMATPGVMSYSSAAASTPGVAGSGATSNAASSTGTLPRGGAGGNAKGSTGGGSGDKKGGGSSSATASITDQKDEFSLKFGDFLSGYHIENSSVSIVPRGLINRSNYCYINTILQALVACPPFYHLMRTIRTLPAAKNAKHPKPFIDAMCSLVGEFSQLPMRSKMPREKGKKDDTPEISVESPFEPVVIHKILNGVRSDIFQIEGRQEDAEEFLGCVLNRLNDEMIEFMKLNKPEQNVVNGEEPTNGEAHGEEDDDWMVICGNRNKGTVTRTTDFGRSPISDIFGGKLRSRVQRDGVPPTYNIQPFFTLQLDIEKAASVKEALEQLVGRDELEGVTCTKTKQEVAAWQQVTLEELPVVLILHLKCFDYKMDGCTKILKTLDFPIELKIDSKLLSSKGKSYTAKQKQYKLFAVVYHDGKEASKGHYITDVFHGGYGSWIRYDDSTVKPMTEYNVLRPRAPRVPYLLYYRRMDTHYHGTNSDGGGVGSHHHRGSGAGGGDGGVSGGGNSGGSGSGRGGSTHSSTGGDRHNSHHHHYNSDHGRGSGGYGSGSGGGSGGGGSGGGHGGSSYGSGGNHYGSGGGGGYGHSNSSQYGK